VSEVLDFDAEVVEQKLAAVPRNAKPEQAAQLMFPDNEQLRAEYLGYEQGLRDGLAQVQVEVEGPSARALPAVVAAALPVIARCVWGGLSGAAIGQISQYVKGEQLGKAKDLIVDACTGCVTAVVPFMSRAAAKRMSNEVAGAVLWLVVKLGPKR
jgi:hypothetical protein